MKMPDGWSSTEKKSLAAATLLFPTLDEGTATFAREHRKRGETPCGGFNEGYR